MSNEVNVEDIEHDGFVEELRSLAADIFDEARQRFANTVERDLDGEVWNTLGETGLARLTGSEDVGGSEGSWPEAAAVLYESASAGVPLPLLEHDLLAGWLRDQAGLPESDSALSTSTQVTETNKQVSVPWLQSAETVVVLDTSGSSPKAYEIPNDELTVVHRTGVSGESRDLVTFPHAEARGVEIRPEVADEWLLRGALGRAVQIAGAADAIARLVIEHASSRVQFGRPIGKFQAVQQLVTEIIGEATMARSITDRAITAVSEHGFGHEESQFFVAAAKASTGGSTETLIRHAHQIHGAIGTALEHPLQRFTRPLIAWRREYGSTNFWEKRLEELTIGQGQDLWAMITS